MMEKVIITEANIGQTQIPGLAVDFKITYHKENQGLLKDVNQDYWLKIIMTQFALIGWGIINKIDDREIIKLAFPFAIKLISEKVKDATLKEYEEKIISRGDDIIPYPYDLDKIDKIEGYEIEFVADNVDIGKRIQTNLIADTIIELRDNINALIYSKNKDNLLKLDQERNILYLFSSVDNREQFSYAIATLGNLVNGLNTDLLRDITGNKEKDKKSFSLLEDFFLQIDNEPNESIEIFRNINRIRQGFPIHSDKTEIIRNLKKFNIDYPIEDYNEAWQVLIDKYRIGLLDLLVKIKTYAA